MARGMKRRADPVHGILLLNKPPGLTSNRALQTVRRLVNAQKAGHTGSLDPGATGMLPLCFGEATKVCAFLLDADKTYRVTAKLGATTDTGDADGTILETSDVPTTEFADWQALLDQFLGHTEQIPPMYSALKKDGKRLYELARKGEIVEREPRPVRIDDIQLLEVSGTRLVFRVSCSKGTYIRTLVEDVARRAGMLAYTVRLHRESVAGFDASQMLDLEELETLAEIDVEEVRARLLPPDQALLAMPEVALDDRDSALFCQGQLISVQTSGVAGLCRVYRSDGHFLGIGAVNDDAQLKPRRVFQMQEKSP